MSSVSSPPTTMIGRRQGTQRRSWLAAIDTDYAGSHEHCQLVFGSQVGCRHQWQWSRNWRRTGRGIEFSRRSGDG